MMKKLWNDDAGFIISVEWLLVFTIVLLGLIIGLTNVRDAIDVELSEAANAILALNQSYSFYGLNNANGTGCTAFVAGSAANDPTMGHTVVNCVDPTSQTSIEVPLP